MVTAKTAPGQNKRADGIGKVSHARFPMAFIKDMLRSWLHSWKRFLAIGLISALGVAVLTGIWAGCQDMYQGADHFYKTQGLYDVQVVSSSGLTDDDLQALRRLPDVRKAQAEEFQKAQTKVNGSKKKLTLVRLHSHGLNQPYLQTGRLPQSKKEAAVTQKFLTDSHLRLGGHIQLEGDRNASQTADNTSELTITGTVLDPQDLVNPQGRRAGGFRRTATSDYRIFLPSKAPAESGNQQQKPVYAAISLRMQGSEQMDTFSDDYEDAVNRMTDQIAHKVQPYRQEARHQELVDNVKEQLEQARQTGQFLQTAEPVSGNQTMSKTADGATKDPATLVPPVRWYLNTRATSGSYSDFKSDIDSIQSLGRAFPVIFLTVAVLMSLTAMTRMVEEDRGLIGTYLALGYGRIPVALRYLLFALLACLIGGGLGESGRFHRHPRLPADDSARFVCRSRHSFGVRLGLRLVRSGPVRRGSASGNRSGLRQRNEADAGATDATQGPQGGRTHLPGKNRTPLAAHVLPQQGHGPQSLPIQGTANHDRWRGDRLHGSDFMRIGHQRHG